MRQSSSSAPSSFSSSQSNPTYHPPPPLHQHHPSTSSSSSSAQSSRPSSYHPSDRQQTGPTGLPFLPLPRKFECIEPDLDPRSTFGETTYVYSFLPPGNISSLVPASSGSVAEAEAEAAVTAALDSMPSGSRAHQVNLDQPIGSDEDENEKDSDLSDDGSGHASRIKNTRSIEFGQDGGQTPEDLARRLGDGSQIEIKHRRRTSRFQFNTLEETFLTNPKPTGTQRKELGAKLGMSPRAVQVWFQNRRAKVKNQAKKAAELQAKSLPMPLLRETPFPPSYSIHPTESSAGRPGNSAVGSSPGENVPKYLRSRHPSEADAYSFTSGRTSIDGSSPSTPGSMLLSRMDLSLSGTTGSSLANTYRQHSGASPQLSSSGSGRGQPGSSSSSSSSSVGPSGAHMGSIYSPFTDPRNLFGMGRRQSMPSYEPAHNTAGKQEEALSSSALGLLKVGPTTQADTRSSLAEDNISVGRSAPDIDQTTMRPSSVDRLGGQGRPESSQHWSGMYSIAPAGASPQIRQSEQNAMPPPPVPSGSYRRPSVGSSASSSRHAPYNPLLSSRRASVPVNLISTATSAPASAAGSIPWNLSSIEDHEGAGVYTQTSSTQPPLSGFSQPLQPPPPPPPSQFDPSYTFSPESYSIPAHQPYPYQQTQYLFQPLPMQRSQQPQHYHHHQQQQHYQQQQQQADSSYAFQLSSVTPVSQSRQRQQQQLPTQPPESLPDSSFSFGSTTEGGHPVPPSEIRVNAIDSQGLDEPRPSGSVQGPGINVGFQEHALKTQPTTGLTNDAWHQVQGNQFPRRESAPAQLLEDFSSMSVLAMRDGNSSYLQNYSPVGNPNQVTPAQPSSITAGAPFSFMQSSSTGSANQNPTPGSQLQLPIYEPFKQQQQDDMNRGLLNEHPSSLVPYHYPLSRSQAPGSEQEDGYPSESYIRVNEDGYPEYPNLQRMSTLTSSDNPYIGPISPKQQQQ